jgi:ATP-dependent DNA helicase RecG
MTFRGKIMDVSFSETRSGLSVVSIVIQDQSGQLVCKWLRKKSYRYDVLYTFRKELVWGKTIIVHGKVTFDYGGKVMMVDEYEVLSDSQEDLIHINRIVPIYPAADGMRPRFLRKLVHEALHAVIPSDPMPEPLRQSEKLPPFDLALKQFHFPPSFEQKEKARQRLAFQELFIIQSALAIVRKKRRSPRQFQYQLKRTLLTPFKQKIGFEFTRSQAKVIREIFNDLTSEFPMNRLLQGDVGSGKTIVALSSMLLACENGYQAVLMAPTEILAEQHYINIKRILESLPVKVGLLTGSIKGKERKTFLQDCAEGKIDIIIGTHALLEKGVELPKCRLVVVDEQHRFGVKHRMALTQRKPTPDVLVMTATPIPRTLALSLYGDLDVSTIDELPPGRQKIHTLWQAEPQAYSLVKNEIKSGRQAYIVYPLVDESDKVELKSAIQEFERLKTEIFKGYSVGLLHGQMKGREKEEVMQDFCSGKFSILVATTVIEVGIDVPNATVMVIQHAERFGLSTLHQLRGRVGRGKQASYCVLIAQTGTEEAQKRIQTLLKSQNGFELAEVDLELRGPGEIFGTSQHGLPDLKAANFIQDRDLIFHTQAIARDWIEKDPELTSQQNQLLREHLRKTFAKTWFLANIA